MSIKNPKGMGDFLWIAFLIILGGALISMF